MDFDIQLYYKVPNDAEAPSDFNFLLFIRAEGSPGAACVKEHTRLSRERNVIMCIG